jgi:acyl-CoA thioesterase FadM
MSCTTEITVDWGDTDAGGLIYYPRFFHFVIVGLNDYFRLATDGEHPMETYRKRGYLLPAVEAQASFSSPLRAGDDAVLETTVVDSGTSSLTVGFTVTRASDGERAAGGEVSFVFVDESFEATPLPEAMRACIRERGDSE